VYSELVEITNVERQAVVDARLPELKTAVERKHQVLGRLADLEDRRVLWLQRYAQSRGINPLELTLASIIDASPEPDRGILARLHAALSGRINQLKELNHRSRALLEAILHSIDTSLHYLLCDDSYSQVYRPQGGLQVHATSARQLLDRRV
jgi:flagellar biosynthesis/type III secretory pathway chaperone